MGRTPCCSQSHVYQACDCLDISQQPFCKHKNQIERRKHYNHGSTPFSAKESSRNGNATREKQKEKLKDS